MELEKSGQSQDEGVVLEGNGRSQDGGRVVEMAVVAVQLLNERGL